MKFKKIQAFTLSELLVVLVISSLIISMAFVVLSMIRSQATMLQGNYEKKQRIQYVERVLFSDINSYATTAVSKNTLLLTSTVDTVHWNFYTKYLVRNSDTIHAPVTGNTLFLDGRPVENGYFDAVQLNFSEAYAQHELFIYKVKDAAYYLNY